MIFFCFLQNVKDTYIMNYIDSESNIESIEYDSGVYSENESENEFENNSENNSENEFENDSENDSENESDNEISRYTQENFEEMLREVLNYEHDDNFEEMFSSILKYDKKMNEFLYHVEFKYENYDIYYSRGELSYYAHNFDIFMDLYERYIDYNLVEGVISADQCYMDINYPYIRSIGLINYKKDPKNIKKMFNEFNKRFNNLLEWYD